MRRDSNEGKTWSTGRGEALASWIAWTGEPAAGRLPTSRPPRPGFNEIEEAIKTAKAGVDRARYHHREDRELGYDDRAGRTVLLRPLRKPAAITLRRPPNGGTPRWRQQGLSRRSSVQSREHEARGGSAQSMASTLSDAAAANQTTGDT